MEAFTMAKFNVSSEQITEEYILICIMIHNVCTAVYLATNFSDHINLYQQMIYMVILHNLFITVSGIHSRISVSLTFVLF